jgi:hypothetical protein
MPRFHITVSSSSRDQIIDLWRVHGVQVNDHGATHDGDILTVHAIAEPGAIRALEGAGYSVAVYENLDEAGRRAQAEVGKGNRFLQQPGQGR